jgi:hypothetical protein
MKQFRQYMVCLLVAASLSLFIVNAAWWVRSYFMADVVMRLSTDKPPGSPTAQPAMPYVARRIFGFAVMRGRIQAGYARESYASFTLVPDGWTRKSVPTRLAMGSRAPWRTLGFGYSHDVLPANLVVTENGAPIQGQAAAQPLAQSWNLWVPCWFIALMTAIGPVLWFRNWSKRYHERHGANPNKRR